MARMYLLDSWFFIAFLDRFDASHRQARRLSAAFNASDFITHDAVLTEVLSFFSGQGSQLRRDAVSAVRSAMDNVEIVPASGSLFALGLRLYERRLDKEYSLVDCMSMELMKERGITHVLTNDHHFRQEGFVVLSDAS